MKRITDRDFKYVPASKTDIRRTFKHERDRLKAAAESREQKVAQLPVRKAAK